MHEASIIFSFILMTSGKQNKGQPAATAGELSMPLFSIKPLRFTILENDLQMNDVADRSSLRTQKCDSNKQKC